MGDPVGEWMRSLPDPTGRSDLDFGPVDRTYRSLMYLNWALFAQARGETENMLDRSQRAAAEVVAWRQSLKEQGGKPGIMDWDDITDRELLLEAMTAVVEAEHRSLRDPYWVGPSLRVAEARLRKLWRRNSDGRKVR